MCFGMRMVDLADLCLAVHTHWHVYLKEKYKTSCVQNPRVLPFIPSLVPLGILLSSKPDFPACPLLCWAMHAYMTWVRTIGCVRDICLEWGKISKVWGLLTFLYSEHGSETGNEGCEKLWVCCWGERDCLFCHWGRWVPEQEAFTSLQSQLLCFISTGTLEHMGHHSFCSILHYFQSVPDSKGWRAGNVRHTLGNVTQPHPSPTPSLVPSCSPPPPPLLTPSSSSSPKTLFLPTSYTFFLLSSMSSTYHLSPLLGKFLLPFSYLCSLLFCFFPSSFFSSLSSPLSFNFILTFWKSPRVLLKGREIWTPVCHFLHSHRILPICSPEAGIGSISSRKGQESFPRP